MRSLANVAILPSFAGCWCGVTPGLFSLDCLPIAEGVLPSPPLHFRAEIADQAMFRRVSGVGLPMLTEFQLWVLRTVMLPLVIVGVKRWT